MKFHIFHDWDKWEWVKNLKVFASPFSDENLELPVEQTMLYRRNCFICHLAQYKRIRIQ